MRGASAEPVEPDEERKIDAPEARDYRRTLEEGLIGKKPDAPELSQEL